MIRFALAPIACLLAAPAWAQADLRSLIIDLAQTSGCAASRDFLDMIVPDKAGLEAAIDAMAAAGEVERSNDGAAVTVLPPLCEAVAGMSLAMAKVLIENAVTGAEGCRMPLAALQRQVVADGMPEAAFEAALTLLEAEGTLSREGKDVVDGGC